MVTMNSPSAPQKPRLLDRVRGAVRARHYSRRTEDAYTGWIKRYIFFHGKRHPSEMGAKEVTRFLSSRRLDGRLAASTQNQGLSGAAQGPSYEAGAFAVKGIPSKPIARRSEIGCSSLQP